MVEGPYRTPPKDDEEFDPEKHTKVDEKSWVRKSAAETTKKAEAEANKRNLVIEEPNWFFRLFGKTNKESGLSVLHEEALETLLENLNYGEYNSPSSVAITNENEIVGKYNGHNVRVQGNYLDYNATINGIQTTKNEAKKIWKKLNALLQQRDKNRKKLKQTNWKLITRKPVLEVLGLLPQRPTKELPETTEPKQLPEKTEE